MKRSFPLILLAVAFFGWLYYSAVKTNKVTCESCITFGGRTDCAKTAGATREEALRQGATVICAKLASGMTEGIRCTNTPPERAECSGKGAAGKGKGAY